VIVTEIDDVFSPTIMAQLVAGNKLTEEDWRSNEAKVLSDFIFISSTSLSAFSALVAYTQSFNMDMFYFIFGFAIIFALIGTISVLVSEVALFPGAYLHYRRRMKLNGEQNV
jgi:hypothetical protein